MRRVSYAVRNNSVFSDALDIVTNEQLVNMQKEALEDMQKKLNALNPWGVTGQIEVIEPLKIEGGD